MKILYYDCFAGISGDMNLGAMIDLGVEASYLKAELAKLKIEGFHLCIKKDQRKGITGTKADVIIENPDNEKHRHLRHIEEIIKNSDLKEKVKSDSLKIFNIVAAAEAKVHNIPKENVHFHEVGALDSIADIVGAAICFDRLKADRIISSPIQLGAGTVKCAHGVMPVPAPATAEIIRGLPVRTGLVQHEATTPTGAAILAAMADEFSEQKELRIIKTAYGIGHRDTEVPNLLRVMLCETERAANDMNQEEAIILESNIDDMNPEHYDFLMDQLFFAGASDVWITPVIMKKSRPATTVSVLCPEMLSTRMKEIIFTESTSIGIREYRITKNRLQRKESVLNTEFGTVRIKQSFYNGKQVSVKPEFNDLKQIAENNGISIKETEKLISKYIDNQ